MFKKKPHIKNLAPLRSSDRRKVVDQIIADYQIEVPHAEEQEEGQAQTSGIGTLRNSLLPEGALSAKFSTTVGQDLKTVNGTVYVGTYASEEPRVLWIRLDDKIIPTVYTLWHHSGVIPLLHTPTIVLDKMRGGADLMTPGLAMGPPFPAKAKKGAIVAIAAYENPSVPVIVGECEIDVASLTSVRGAKGHAVKGIHWEGDEIWAWSPSNKPGSSAPDHLDGWFEQDGGNAELKAAQQAVEKLEIEDDDEDKEDGGVPIGIESQKPEEQDFEEAPREKKDWTTKDIDSAFRNAFLYAMHSARETRKGEPSHGIEFPIQQSQFMSNYILPYLPIFSADDANALQLKKTSWKNIKKFIKALDKEVLLKSKDRNGGETVILDVDFDDQSIAGFTPYRLPKKQSSTGGGATANGDSSSSTDDSVGQQIKRVALLKPRDKVAAIFAPAKADTHAYYLPSELRPIVTQYLEAENLIPATNKRLVTINPVLANAIFDSSSAIDNEVLAKGTIPRDALMERISTHCCAQFYAILRNNETRESCKPKAGTPPSIKITLETRSGNKTATRVSGLEAYHVRPVPLAEELQKTCASSTSVAQLVGTSPKNPVMEIMVQGPQKDAVLKALEKRGIRKEWVEVLDKTKKKK